MYAVRRAVKNGGLRRWALTCAGSLCLVACGSSVNLSDGDPDADTVMDSITDDVGSETSSSDGGTGRDEGTTDSRAGETSAPDSLGADSLVEDSATLDSASSGDAGSVDSGSVDTGSGDTSPCWGGLVVCGSTCSDLATDPYNCGSCDHVCPTGSGCTGGTCDPCPASEPTLCVAPTAYCADTQSDPDNCGTCGHVCPTGFACSKGACSELKSRHCDLTTVKVESASGCDSKECASSAPAETGFGASGDYHEWSFGGGCLVCSCLLL